jgi:hypothetical protein
LSVTAIVADGFTRSSAADRNGIVISLQDIANTPGVATDPRLFLLGSGHPKAGDAASQEAWPVAPKLSLMSKGRRRIRATFIKFCGKMTHIRQGLRSGMAARHRRGSILTLPGVPHCPSASAASVAASPNHDDDAAQIESRERDPNCSVVLAGYSARLQCSRGFRLIPSSGSCDAIASASLFSRVARRQRARGNLAC